MPDNEVTVLIVDLEISFLNETTMYLEDNGYRALATTDGISIGDRMKDERFDIIILGSDLPDGLGFDLLKDLTMHYPMLPIIFASEKDQYVSDAVRSARYGAWDCIAKPLSNPEILLIAIERAVEKKSLLAAQISNLPAFDESQYDGTSIIDNPIAVLEQAKLELIRTKMLEKLAEKELSQRNDLLVFIIESIPNPFFIEDYPSRQIISANIAARESGLLDNETSSMFNEINKDDPVSLGVISLIKATHKPAAVEYVLKRDNKSPRTYDIHAYPVIDPRQEITQIIYHAIDISDRKLAERENRQLMDKLMQAHKLESLGSLIGGIAHDFNNMLTTIIGYGEMIQSDLKDSPSLKEELDVIIDTGRKAAQLTKQILSFSKNQMTEKTVISPNTIIEKIEKILKRMIGEDIELILDLNKSVKYIKVDPIQIEQILMNLSVNARDALPKGGRLIISTGVESFDKPVQINEAAFAPGDYVKIAAEDNGCGIEPENLDKIFDPFFSTKERDKGTGLGLATVIGIVKQYRGFVRVKSQVNEGTLFECFIPACESANCNQIDKIETIISGGSETILVVEDDNNIRDLLLRFLSKQGYNVVGTSDARQALDIAINNKTQIDLILTDVILPGLDGPALVKKLKETAPDLKVVYMSGYTDDKLFGSGILEKDDYLIRKPIDLMQLNSALRSVLNGSRIRQA